MDINGNHKIKIAPPPPQQKTHLLDGFRSLLCHLSVGSHLMSEGTDGLLELVQLPHLPGNGVGGLLILLLEGFEPQLPLFCAVFVVLGLLLELRPEVV